MSKLYIIVPHQCLLDVCATFLLCFRSVNHTLKINKKRPSLAHFKKSQEA